MFLVDSAEASADWDGVNATVKNILEKAGTEIVSIEKWDDRRLAYEIGGKVRGTYILCYFKAGGERLHEIERDVQLSERVIRVLILCAEHMMQEDIEKDTPAMRAEKSKQKATKATAAEAESAAEVPETEQLGDKEEEKIDEVAEQGEEEREMSS
jgi:ribosomal protein S6